MNDVQAMLAALAEIGKELHLVAKHLRTGGEKEGQSDGFNVTPDASTAVIQAVGPNPRRSKWWIINVDAAGGNSIEYGYRPDFQYGRGARLGPNGGSYLDDSLRCYKGPIYVRCDPTLAAGTKVPFRAGEEWS